MKSCLICWWKDKDVIIGNAPIFLFLFYFNMNIQQMRKKILINTPFITSPAGVASYYHAVKPFFSGNVVYNQYFTRFKVRKIIKNDFIAKIIYPVFIVFNVLKFIFYVIRFKKPVILLNPSLNTSAMARDAFYLRIAKYMRCKTVVFVRGWNDNYYNRLEKNRERFRKTWYKADAFFVLASEFSTKLIALGITAPIHLTTTKVSDQLLEGVSLKKRIKLETLTFIARVEKEKGIYIALDAFALLNKKNPNLKFNIVGRGYELPKIEVYIKNKNISNVVLTGPLYNEDLKNAFKNADIFLFPSHHHEGMPNSVLEAMAFGLPVITRPVGGLVDFFENDKMGYMIESLNPQDYADKIEYLINNIDKANEMAAHNWNYARKHFLASKVAVELENMILSVTK